MGEEKLFETRVKRWLESVGVYPLGCPADKMDVPPVGYYEKRWGGGYAKAGLPDMHIVVSGISVDLELKSAHGRPSDLQRHNIRQINEAGSMAFVLYPDGFERFKNIVKGVLQCKSVIPALTVLKAANTATNCDTLTG